MQNSLTDLEKLLYNKHLSTYRRLKNKPFKFKKNFTDIENTDKHKHLTRIATLFKKHRELNIDVYFEAPYKLYPDVEYFGLDYYSTLRAVRSYTLYKKTLFLQDPDSQLEDVKDSLSFITKFCIQQKILLHQYPFFRQTDTFAWLTHYKENKINIYSIMEFSNVVSSVQTLAEDIQRMFVKDFVEQFKSLHLLYIKSQLLRPYLKKTVPLLNNFVNQQLTKTKNHNII